MIRHTCALLPDCDGPTDIPCGTLPEADRAWYDFRENGSIIRRCDGEDALMKTLGFENGRRKAAEA